MTKPATIPVPRNVAERFVALWHSEDMMEFHLETEALVNLLEAALRAEEHALDGFPEFWAIWPRRQGKRLAQLAWTKTASVRPELDVLLAAVRAQAMTEQWRKEEMQYIPLPASWLNGHRWEDELVARAVPEPERTPEQRAEAQRISDEEQKRIDPERFARQEAYREADRLAAQSTST